MKKMIKLFLYMFFVGTVSTVYADSFQVTPLNSLPTLLSPSHNHGGFSIWNAVGLPVGFDPNDIVSANVKFVFDDNPYNDYSLGSSYFYQELPVPYNTNDYLTMVMNSSESVHAVIDYQFLGYGETSYFEGPIELVPGLTTVEQNASWCYSEVWHEEGFYCAITHNHYIQDVGYAGEFEISGSLNSNSLESLILDNGYINFSFNLTMPINRDLLNYPGDSIYLTSAILTFNTEDDLPPPPPPPDTSAVPEPSSALLMFAAGITGIVMRKKITKD